MPEDFMANVHREGTPIEATEPEKTDEPEKPEPAAPPAEEKKDPEKQSPSSEGGEGREAEDADDKLPFHKHPRFKRVIDEKNSLAERVETLSKELEDMRKGAAPKAPADAPAPSWFTKAFGDDPELWKEYQGYEIARREEIKSEIEAEATQSAKKEQDEKAYWEGWVDKQLTALEDEGLAFDRNKLLKVALDYKPTDDEGNIDFRKAHDLLTKLEPAPKQEAKAKKDVAAKAAPAPEKEAPKRDFVTPDDIRGKSFRQLVNES